jgi:spermidine/putrescine transport system permease protein
LLTGLLARFQIDHVQLMYNWGAVLLGMVYNYLPYMVLPIYAALEKLDPSLLEAASDLGASPLKSFFKITLPLSSRGVIAGSIMVFIPALGDYVTPDLLGGAKSMLIGNLIQNQFLIVRDWAFGSAVSTVLIVIVGLAVWVYLNHGETVYESD